MKWKVNKEETEKHWLVLESEDAYDYPKYKAIVKWDGCIHFDQISYEEENSQYFHICDLNNLIKRLRLLKKEAIKHFGKEWK